MKRLSSLAVIAALVGTSFTLSGGEAGATPAPWTYFTMSDGTKIAAAVRTPAGCTPAGPCPVLFRMDGYDAGGSAGIDPAAYGNNYITVHASIRGTGCSGGVFNLFDRRHAEDGYEIITSDLPALPGSNGDVGITGHSYPGLTGWLVASTNPPNLKAIAISGLIDDLYRGIVYPGGLPNYGFPAIWTGVIRPGFELAGNAGRYIAETASGDPTCAANIATRAAHVTELTNSVLQNPILNGGTSIEDGDWWRSHSTLTWINGIQKPIHITQQYQDEQTGPRGGHVLFERIPAGVPKRLVLTNGVHGTTSVGQADRVKWLDCYVRGVCVGDIADASKRVRLHFETSSAGVNAPYTAGDWPLPSTGATPDASWTRYYLHPDGTLDTTGGAGEASSSYVSTTAGRQITGDLGNPNGLVPNQVEQTLGQATFVDGPDQLRYATAAFATNTAIAGPINLTLRASSTAVNTDFFVDVLDLDTTTGEVLYLQRGMQRASHREINLHPTRTDYTPGGDIYRAWHPHTNTTTKLLTPTLPETFEIEVFPVGHVFRAGHKLVIQVHAPPPSDPLSTYAWVSGMPPAVNTVFHSGASSLLVPVITSVPPIGAEPACGAMTGVPCFTPADS